MANGTGWEIIPTSPARYDVGMPDTAESGGSPAATASVPWFAPTVFLATAFGVGRVPFAPGTFGAMLGLPLALAIGWLSERFAAGEPVMTHFVEVGLVVGLCFAGIPICSRAAALMGRKDPGAIVLDEVASMPLALLLVPLADRTPQLLAVAFVILRIFDIGKPFPCRQLERLPAGLGIMADDWGAAAWTAVCLAIARWQHWI
jgi:phosphatidylglycerophosphatase A